MLKQQEAFDKCDALIKELEDFLKNTPKRDRRLLGIILCQHIAVSSAEVKKNIFDPLKVLSEAQKDLQSVIAEEVDSEIEGELLDYVAKIKDQK